MRLRRRISTRTLIRLCRIGQALCLLTSLSGVILIFYSPPAVEAQACQGVCESGDVGACLACEQVEHYPGNVAAGSMLTLGGLLGSVALGDLCRGLEGGGGSGDGGRREGGAYTLPEPGTLTNFLNSLGLTNPDGTPIDANSVSSALDQMTRDQQEGGGGPSKGPHLGGFGTRAAGGEGGESGEGGEGAEPSRAEGGAPVSAEEGAEPARAEGETFRGVQPEGGPPRGPATEEARNRWNLFETDGEGRTYDHSHRHILNIDADGNVSDLRGNPVSNVVQDDVSLRVTEYTDADGNTVKITQRDFIPETRRIDWKDYDLPTGESPRTDLSPEVARQWNMVGAGPNGELRGPDGRIIGHIDNQGNMVAVDGRKISGYESPEAGRLHTFTTDDGNAWRWSEADGGFKPVKLPPGEAPRPMSEAEWKNAEVVQERLRNLTPEQRARLEAETGLKPGQRPAGPQEGEGGGESEGEKGQEGARPAEGGEESSGTKTTSGAAPQRAAGAGATAEQGGARPSAEPTRAEAGETPRTTTAEGDARAVAGEPARAAAPDAEGATRVVDGGGGGLASSAFNRYMDIQNIQQRYDEHIAAGMSPAEAFSLAVAQTGAGNIASDLAPIPGVTNPLSGAALSSLLPGAMSNVMPDQAIQSWVGTGYGALSALGETIGTSAYAGELDTSAFDRFAESVANRPGADPFSGWAQVSQLVGEESARTDGGSLLSDLDLIRSTGAGVDVANEAMSSFQQQVDAGRYGAPLQGINYLTQAAAEVVADPTTTIGQFVDDVKNIYNYGVGDGFWDESLNHTVEVIKNTPSRARSTTATTRYSAASPTRA